MRFISKNARRTEKKLFLTLIYLTWLYFRVCSGLVQFAWVAWVWHRERIVLIDKLQFRRTMADDPREKLKIEMAERLRQFNERIDAAIDQ